MNNRDRVITNGLFLVGALYGCAYILQPNVGCLIGFLGFLSVACISAALSIKGGVK